MKKIANILTIGFLFLWIAPIIWLFVASFLPTPVITGGVNYQGTIVSLDNYMISFERKDWLQGFINSMLVSSISTFIIISLSALSAYALSRRSNNNLNIILWLLSTRILPPATFLVPLVLLFQYLNLMDSWASLIICNILTNLGILAILMKGYIDKISKEFEEYLRISGFREWEVISYMFFSKLKLPIILSSIICFLFSWNEFFFASALTSAGNSQTLPVIVSGFITLQDIMWGPMFASCLLTIMPAIASIWFIQKSLIKSLSFNLIKINEGV